MRICRFDDNRIGLLVDGSVRDVSAVLSRLPTHTYPFPTHDVLIEALPGLRKELLTEAAKAKPLSLDRVSLRSPVANSGKLIAAPVNYPAHLEEAIADPATFSREHVRRIEETGLFLKASSSLIGPADPIVLTYPQRRTDHEIELAVVIGRTGKNIPAERAPDHIAGFCIGLDITIRGPEERSLRKSCDCYSVLGPWLSTPDEIAALDNLQLRLCVDGAERQLANTRDLILDVPSLIAFASSYYTLYPGDVIFTGTPEGVGPIRPGNLVHAEITQLGELSMRVR